MIELSEQELCALDACVDVASEGPPSFVIPAQRAVRKLRYPQAFDRAKAFQHSYRDIMPSEVSVDYVKGIMYHWYLCGNDYDSTTAAQQVVEEMFPFWLELTDDMSQDTIEPAVAKDSK